MTHRQIWLRRVVLCDVVESVLESEHACTARLPAILFHLSSQNIS